MNRARPMAARLKKVRVNLEPRSAHGRAVNKSRVNLCTVAVMSYMADMSSDVTGYTEPIISWVLSNNTQNNTQHKTGN